MVTYSPCLVGSTADLNKHSASETRSNEASYRRSSAIDPSRDGPSFIGRGYNYFKSAQWSPDGTTILASSADSMLRSFVLPTDLLTSTEPHDLQPYSTHKLPEPAYATAFYPQYSLHEPSTTLFLTSLRQLPIRLYTPFAPAKVASYPLISPTTEAFIAPHSLEFSLENPNHFYTGSESCISTFDIQRHGEGPFDRIYTTPSRRGTADGRVGMKGIISALASNADCILAAGTFTRWVGLCDTRGGGGTPAVFPLDGDKKHPEGGAGQGTGITQLLWSSCARYLCVIERNTDGIGVWDIRGPGQRLAWLKGRKALTPQRLGAEVVGGEVWAGGTDGIIRVWERLGEHEGIIEPGWEFHAHDDVVCASTFHYSGAVLATASGQKPLGTSSSFRMQSDMESNEENLPCENSTLSGTDSSSEETLSKSRTVLTEGASLPVSGNRDSSLKVWNL